MSTFRAPYRGLAAVAALALFSACAEQEPPTAAVSPDDIFVRAEESQLPPPDDPYEGEQEFAEVSAEVPGYAGHWYEGDTRVVALTDLSQQDRAIQVLDAREQPELGEVEKTGGGTRFVQARHDYPTLRGWRDRAADRVLAVPGATFVDLGEVENRIVVGIADEGARSGVERELAAAGVPADGAAIEVSGAGESQPLTGMWRPLEGGWLITSAAGVRCTLGFISRTAAGIPVFVTNSHCTPAFWGFDGIGWNQPAAPSFVGNEMIDPAGWPCPGGICRRSDATAVRIAPGVTFANRIVRTTFVGIGGPGSTTQVLPAWTVVGNVWYPPLGAVVDKVGWVTGWTRGRVRRTCVTTPAFPPAPPGRTVLCQYLATYVSAPGDSGSPVFIPQPGTTNALLTGLHWGRFPGINQAIFSPRGGVRLDLGV